VDRPVVLCGLGKVGGRVLTFLRTAGLPVAVIDLHADPADPRLADLTYVRGDCRDPAVLERAGVAAARGVLVVTSDDLVNVSTAFAVRKLNPDARVVVRMFNQGLIPRLGAAVRNTTALSVSALTAPLLALTAVTGDGLGAFRLDAGPQQVAEIVAAPGGELAGDRLADVAGRHQLLILAYTPPGTDPQLFHAVDGDTRVSPGGRLVVCGGPDRLEPLLAFDRGELLPGVKWAGRVRRLARTAGRTLGAVDLPVKLVFSAVFLTLFVSTLLFRYGIGTGWAEGLYETVGVIATGGELHGEGRPPWAKVFLSVLKLAGAALFAGFTAILTNYLLRAKLGGAFEAGKIPDGGHVVVCGLGNVGFRCVEELVKMGRPVVAVERAADAPFAATVRRMGVPVVLGDATVPEVLRQTRAESARAVIAATASELANLEIALLVREVNPGQRVVVRLTDPDFAQAVRDGAGIKLAVAAPAVAAPAFAAALFGDRVHTLVSVAGQTLVVVELTVQPDDPCLHEQTLVAAMADYRFLPVAINGGEPFAAAGIPRAYRLAAGDRLTAVATVPDLERLLRREPAPAEWAVEVDAHPAIATDALLPVVRAARGCSQAEAERLLAEPAFTLATGLTRGQSEELYARVSRERAKARVVPAGNPV
jgi:Trk K+ transport system NAD-binding subunit